MYGISVQKYTSEEKTTAIKKETEEGDPDGLLQRLRQVKNGAKMERSYTF